MFDERPRAAAAMPGVPLSGASGNPNATHADSWAAQLHASLFDDDVGTLSPEQSARREALDGLRRQYQDFEIRPLPPEFMRALVRERDEELYPDLRFEDDLPPTITAPPRR